MSVPWIGPSYRALTVPNEAYVLLVSDLDSDKAGESLNVSLGAFYDPNGLPGHTNFHIDMLYLVTNNYPEEG